MSFSGKFRYRIKFSLDDFAIRTEDNKSDLEYISDKTTSSFNMVFSESYSIYCAVFQAAERYYYESIDLPRPPMNGFWKACLRLCVYPNSVAPGGELGNYETVSRLILADRPVVSIFGLGKFSGKQSSDSIYGTTIHELTHAAHYGLDTELYPEVEHRVRESIATGVELYLARQRYSSYPEPSYSINGYTAIMRDLVDGVKHISCFSHYDDDWNYSLYSSSKSYYDSISSAFTYSELVEAVKTCSTPEDWQKRILLLYPSRVDKVKIEKAFEYWFD